MPRRAARWSSWIALALPVTAFAGGPESTLSDYFAAMAVHDGRPTLGLYSADTRTMLKRRPQTVQQMDSTLRTYRTCSAERTLIQSDLAVIRYPVAQRTCSPWFFRREEGEWRLDLTAMQRLIRFGRGNAWRLDPGQPSRYDFAFEDWAFDGNGFPVADDRGR